jgi:hypothetical protein
LHAQRDMKLPTRLHEDPFIIIGAQSTACEVEKW